MYIRYDTLNSIAALNIPAKAGIQCKIYWIDFVEPLKRVPHQVRNVIKLNI
jgi:hypothetical protein